VLIAIVLFATERVQRRRARGAVRGLAARRSAPDRHESVERASDEGDTGWAPAGNPWFPIAMGSAGSDGSSADRSPDATIGLDRGPAWQRWIAEEEARIRRFHRSATVVLVELAGLERLAALVGDESAHQLIPPLARALRRSSRETDHVVRLGPTQFAVLLPETDEIRAINYVERIRSVCDAWLEAGAVMLRLSVGWAEINADQWSDRAIGAAERRLSADRERVAATLLPQAVEPAAERAILTTAHA
jgi:diguanylate cyclase (GGDEF)-like protein